ncbi:hypothetical protein AVEN_8231-1 [Araneus ventricosus]|uniref:Uncharacterized protein n=1 Tax=Araneus ventricosus TaxID=182803 RepID=A0A4Y2V5R5_ARAVE|nr:hypothetical protein AVEN_8231-1 [Araneus ventricosus]
MRRGQAASPPVCVVRKPAERVPAQVSSSSPADCGSKTMRVSQESANEADGMNIAGESDLTTCVHAHQLHHEFLQAQAVCSFVGDPGAGHRQGDGVYPPLPVHAGQVFGEAN